MQTKKCSPLFTLPFPSMSLPFCPSLPCPCPSFPLVNISIYLSFSCCPLFLSLLTCLSPHFPFPALILTLPSYRFPLPLFYISHPPTTSTPSLLLFSCIPSSDIPLSSIIPFLNYPVAASTPHLLALHHLPSLPLLIPFCILLVPVLLLPIFHLLVIPTKSIIFIDFPLQLFFYQFLIHFCSSILLFFLHLSTSDTFLPVCPQSYTITDVPSSFLSSSLLLNC